ncbi:MAG: molybdopterin-dependent oxidoreductase [Helicobacteraceae bacterium]|jgi:formate dehydrogenase major subunit|nr:molybdopterin-dependent oxidoreductase [Helicobacteraceae bacterium]
MRKKAVCAYCGTGCEIIAEIENNAISRIDGDSDGAVSQGAVCVKGRFGFDFATSPSRINGARVKRAFIEKNRGAMPAKLQKQLFLLSDLDNDFFACDLDIALNVAAWKTRQILDRFGASSFGFIGGARSSCESAYMFQKFAREVIETPNIDNCARVCHSPSLAGLKRTLGEGAASNPFEDIFAAELIVIIGSNTTSAHPVVGAKILEAKRRGAQLAVIDTRNIKLAKVADYALIIPFESNLLILNMIAYEIVEKKLYNAEFVNAQTANFKEYKKALIKDGLNGKELLKNFDRNGYIADRISRLAETIANHKTLFVWGLGVTEQIDGSFAVSAIANLALLSANIGKIGAGVMPLRGQNNVQGACDMGCLPYYETGYKTPRVIGLNTPQMIDAAAIGTIKAIFNMGEDIAHIHANQQKTQKALNNLEFLCVNELFMSSVAKHADIVFGVKSSYEKNGIYINAERRLHLSLALIESDLLDDWEIFAALSKLIDRPIALNSAEEIWQEARARSPEYFGDISYEKLRQVGAQGTQWRGERLYTQGFHTADRRARFYFAKWQPRGELSASKRGAFWLTTGRALEQYNNGAQTSESDRLLRKAESDLLHICPNDAQILGQSSHCRLTSAYGSSSPLRVKIDEDIREGTLFCTFHHARSRINYLFGDECDPITKTPRFKAIEVRLEPC